MRAVFTIAATLMLVAHLAPGQGTAVVTLYPKQELGEVNALLLGNNQLAYQDGRDIYSRRGAGIWDPDTRQSVPEYVRLANRCGLSASRWPGGCGAHQYNWKKTVGSLADRPEQAFGLPEFLTWCRDTASVPVITVAAYWGDASDAADLVEYLNAPNDGSNPNGGRDWAALRAADGHPPPYEVTWFEYGNETYHGEHQPAEGRTQKRRYTPEEYAARYLRYRSAMKEVDAEIKLGAVLQKGMTNWNRGVLEGAGENMDFAIDHTYLPAFQEDTTPDQSRLLLQAATACGKQLQRRYDTLNALVEEVTGRTDLPWAITEFNGHYVQAKPVPYRQTLANALRNAENLRVMMNPDNRIAMANFWQFANEYWGMVQGYVHRNEPLKVQANFLVFQLYAQHLKDTLIQSRVTCDTWDFDGGAGVLPRRGEERPETVREKNLMPSGATWTIEDLSGVKQKTRGPLLAVEFPGRDLNYYHAEITMPAMPDTWYRVKGLIKTDQLTSSRGACLQVGDARGWEITKSCAISNEVIGTSEWREVSVDYKTLPTTEAIAIMARRLGNDDGDDAVSGLAYYRVFSVQAFEPANLGAVDDVTALASKSRDGSVSIILVNTNFDRDNQVTIDVAGRPPRLTATANAWLLSGPAPWATNLGRKPRVRVSLPRLTRTETGWRVPLPRHSMMAVELTP